MLADSTKSSPKSYLRYILEMDAVIREVTGRLELPAPNPAQVAHKKVEIG
ncbi:hypothetical protein ACSAZL_11025 [Methanosarcina sp. T3]